MREDIDIITAAISGDKRAVLKDQLERLDREIIDRLAINITARQSIHELISDVRRDILEHEPPHEGAPDDLNIRRDRMMLKREFRTLVKDLLIEQRSCWNDTQVLKAEVRNVERDLLVLKQRDRRLTEFT